MLSGEQISSQKKRSKSVKLSKIENKIKFELENEKKQKRREYVNFEKEGYFNESPLMSNQTSNSSEAL